MTATTTTETAAVPPAGTDEQATRVASRERRDPWVSMSAHVTFTAEWAGHIGRVVIDGKHGSLTPMSMHLDVEEAAQLAADLDRAVIAARATEVAA